MRRFGLLLSTLVSLAACGGGSPGNTGGADAGIDPVAYFGLQKDRCFEYSASETAQAVPDLGVAVEEIVDFSLGDRTIKTSVIFYRAGGLAMKDYVGVEGSELKLYKREFPATKSTLYNPPLTLLKMPVRGGDVVQSSGTAAVRDGAGKLLIDPPQQQSLSVNVFSAVPVNLPIGQSVNAFPLTYTLNPAGRQEVRAFVPGTGDPSAIEGFVKIVYNFTTDDAAPAPTYKLQGLRQLDGKIPCGMAP